MPAARRLDFIQPFDFLLKAFLDGGDGLPALLIWLWQYLFSLSFRNRVECLFLHIWDQRFMNSLLKMVLYLLAAGWMSREPSMCYFSDLFSVKSIPKITGTMADTIMQLFCGFFSSIYKTILKSPEKFLLTLCILLYCVLQIY